MLGFLPITLPSDTEIAEPTQTRSVAPESHPERAPARDARPRGTANEPLIRRVVRWMVGTPCRGGMAIRWRLDRIGAMQRKQSSSLTSQSLKDQCDGMAAQRRTANTGYSDRMFAEQERRIRLGSTTDAIDQAEARSPGRSGPSHVPPSRAHFPRNSSIATWR